MHFMCVFCPYVCLYTTCAWCLQKSKEGVRASECGVTDGYMNHTVGAENQADVLSRATSARNQWLASLALVFRVLRQGLALQPKLGERVTIVFS